jgi:hypothetical protein
MVFRSSSDFELHEPAKRSLHVRFKADPGGRGNRVIEPHIRMRQSAFVRGSHFGGDHQPAELSQSLGYQYAGHDGIPGKMAFQESLVAPNEPLAMAADV